MAEKLLVGKTSSRFACQSFLLGRSHLMLYHHPLCKRQPDRRLRMGFQKFPADTGSALDVCSSMRSSRSSEQDNSSMEVPASPFQQQPQRHSGIGPERLHALLGPISSDGPPVPQSGFSAALITPRSNSTLSRSALVHAHVTRRIG